MKDYLIWGGIILAGWFLISRPMSKEEADRSPRVRKTRGLISLIVVGACIWFAWWVLATKCNGGC
jgi:hypothetical protein